MVKLTRGWISLSRKIQESFIWDDKPFAKGQAWIDMLLLANHEAKEFLSKNEVVLVERGSFLTSDQRLADKWGWGRKKVRLFLELLEEQSMIVTKRNSKGTCVSIVNYGVYQVSENKKEQQKNIKGTTEEHQRNTNNNVNNDNNVNNNISSRFTPPTLEEVRAYCLERGNKVDCEKWFDFYESKGWFVGKNKMKNWKAAVRTWESDEKTKPVQQQKPTNKFHQFPQRPYTGQDYSSLEQALLNKGR